MAETATEPFTPPAPAAPRPAPASLKRFTSSALVAALAVSLVAIAPSMGSHFRYVVSLGLIYFCATSGYTVLVGTSGQFAFAQGAFFAAGAYGVAVLTGSKYHWSFPVVVLLVALTCFLAGYLLALLCTRMSGIYLAFGTLAFQYTAALAIISLESITKGSRGIAVEPMSLLGYLVDSEVKLLVAIVIAACAFAVVLRNLLRSDVGRSWLALRDSEPAARAAGINVRSYRALAFAISAVTAGLAGVLFAEVSGFITPDSFSLELSITFFAIIVLGGMGSVPGALAGSAVLALAPEVLRPLKDYRQLFFGLVIVLSIRFLPGGLASIPRTVTGAVRRGRQGRDRRRVQRDGIPAA
jgi:ABC-type branched-subunit amino acid transport system permease subunit